MIWQNIQNHKYGNAFLNVDGRGKKAAAAAAAAAAGSAGNTGAGGSGVAGATGGNGDAGIIYRELIKRPMDLHMIKQRIKDGVRLLFLCLTLSFASHKQTQQQRRGSTNL